MNPQEQLKDIICNGVVLDLADAEEASALEEFIGVNAEVINVAKFGAFFGTIQRFLDRQIILSVARLYEQPKRYPIRSIPAALEMLEKNAATINILDRPALEKELSELGLDQEMLKSLTAKELTQTVVKHFKPVNPTSSKNPDFLLDCALEATKTLRNKYIAHHEVIVWDELPKPTYHQLKQLIDAAKDFVSVVGLPYLSTVYKCDDGEYLLSIDATRSQRCLKRILEKLKVHP